MLRTLFFFLKIAVLVAIALWVAERPGTVRIEWLDTTVTMHMGVFLLGALGIMLLAMVLFRVLKGLADLPKTMSRYKRETGREKGYRALTLGLTAVAAGDRKAARYQAFRARKFLPDDQGLPRLLEAQAARLNGDENAAAEYFAGLLENKDAAFLGIRGLLQGALEDNDLETARLLADRALELHPKQKWILKIAYDLQIRARDFESALVTLYRAEKAGALPTEKANSDRIAMLLMKSSQHMQSGQPAQAIKEMEKAYSYDKRYIPTIVYLAKAYLLRGQRRKAVKVIEKAWKENTHPDLVTLWLESMPQSKKDNKAGRLKWCARLVTLNTKSAEAHLAVAKTSMDCELWGEARSALNMAEAIRPSARLYKLYAELEERSTHDEIAIKSWLEKAADAPFDRVWICKETGRIYADWSPVAEPHGSFNSIVWDFPASNDNALLLQDVLTPEHHVVLEAPK